MLGFKEMLDGYIKKSGMSHRELSRRCKERGTSVSQAYISQMVKGDVNPPSEEVLKILSEVTGGDPEELILVAYMEKAPSEIKDALNKTKNINDILKRIFKFYFSHLQRDHLNESDFNEESGIEKVQNEISLIVNSDPDELYNQLSFQQKIDILNILNADAIEKEVGINELLNDYKLHPNQHIRDISASHLINSALSIPILGTVAAGYPIERNENIEGYELVEKEFLRGRDGFILMVKGDSMIGDNIFNGDRVVVVAQSDIASSEIAVVSVNGDEATLKRVKCQNDMCMLIPSNPTMQPMLVPSKDVFIIGKVIEVRHNFE